MDNESLERLAWYVRPLHRLWWRIALIGPLAFVLSGIILRSSAEDPEANLKSSREALLAAAPKAPPENLNAAVVYEKAFKLYPKLKFDKGADPTANLAREGAYYEGKDVSDYLNAFEPAIKELDAAAEIKECVFQIKYEDGIAVDVPHLSKIRHAARLFALRARVHAHRGEHALAAADIAHIKRLAEHLGPEPVVLSGLVTVTLRSMAVAAAQLIILYDPPSSKADIEAYRRALPPTSEPNALHARYIAAEQRLTLITLDKACVEEADLDSLSVSGGTEVQSQHLPWFIVYGSLRNSYIDAMSLTVDPKTRSDVERRVTEGKLKGVTIMARLMMPMMAHIHTAFARQSDASTAADFALAGMLYRLDNNGAFPERLEVLLPKYIASIPNDTQMSDPFQLHIAERELTLRDNETRKVEIPKGSLFIHSSGKKNWIKDKSNEGYAGVSAKGSFTSEDFNYAYFIVPNGQAKPKE